MFRCLMRQPDRIAGGSWFLVETEGETLGRFESHQPTTDGDRHYRDGRRNILLRRNKAHKKRKERTHWDPRVNPVGGCLSIASPILPCGVAQSRGAPVRRAILTEIDGRILPTQFGQSARLRPFFLAEGLKLPGSIWRKLYGRVAP